MTTHSPPKTLPRSRVVLIVVTDVIAILLGAILYFWLRNLDSSAAIGAFVSCLVFGGFFNLVTVLVTLKP